MKKITGSLWRMEAGEVVVGPNPQMTGDLSGLRGDCDMLRGDCTGLVGDCSHLWGNCTNIRGDCTGLIGSCHHLLGDVTYIRGDITGIRGDCSCLSGDVTGLYGDVTGLTGEATGIVGDLDKCKLTDETRAAGVDIRILMTREKTFVPKVRDRVFFPKVSEIATICKEYVAAAHGGQWPEDDWLWFMPAFALNMVTDDVTDEKSVTFYAVDPQSLDPMTHTGVHIVIEAGWEVGQ